MEPYAIAATAVVLSVCLVLVLWNPVQSRLQQAEDRRAVRSFRLHREVLEAKFFDLASAVGKPRGLRWLECDWQDAVTFGRDRGTGLVTAFVAVDIRFEAIAGGDMEDVEAVSNIRDATAVFHFQKGHWGTGGRALFNMDPTAALAKLESQYAPLSTETPSHAARGTGTGQA